MKNPPPHPIPADGNSKVLDAAASPGVSPSLPASGRQSPNLTDRRETILSLVEMLLAQNDSSRTAINTLPSFEDDKDVRDIASVDEHIQVAGAETFLKLQRRINNLDKELRNFSNAARQLGSSVAILSSAFHLRERLAQVLFLYHENAADLFPRKVQHISLDFPNESPTSSRRRRGLKRIKGKAQLHLPRPIVTHNLDPETFPDQLELLSKEVSTFVRCLNEFPEFTDEAVNASIMSFTGDLKYWASCLREYSGQFRFPPVQRYIHDLSAEMGQHFDELTSSLSMFIEVGVPTIRFAQKHGANNLLNLSTVATFFSAVTATTMQFSYELDRSGMSDAVNSFWFASLVFSIAAAVNSLLGLTWKQAMYRSPGHRVPWWVMMWIKRSPLVFLVLSVACFSIGLCCFAYASHQAAVTSTITTVLTTFTSFGLAAVSAWFASERWAFARHKGQKWLSDVLNEGTDTFLQLSGISAIATGCVWLYDRCSALWDWIARLYTAFVQTFTSCFRRSCLGGGDDVEARAGTPPAPEPSPTYAFDPKDPLSPIKPRTSDATAVMSEPSMPASPTTGPTVINSPVDKLSLSDGHAGNANPTSPTKQRWRKAVLTVAKRINADQGTGPSSFPTGGATPGGMGISVSISGSSGERGRPVPRRQRTTSSNFNPFGPFDNRRKGTDLIPITTTKSRVTSLVPKLVELEPTQDLAAHAALVRHMQFSPDGRFLATSSWDKTSTIFAVGHPCVPYKTLPHGQNFVGQVAWSPTGRYLLTKIAKGVKVWTPEDAFCRKTISRDNAIETITWMPNDDAFLSVEESTVVKLDLDGKVLDQYQFTNVKLHDVAVTPDSIRLIGVGPLMKSPSGLKPSKSRAEKRLVVFNMLTKEVECQVPMLEDVRDVTLTQTARHGIAVLVSYEHKAAPQLWKLELVKDRDSTNLVGRLTLRHTYMPKVAVDFAGPSYFGGRNNELVLCAGKAGDIHIWDQESAALLHFIRAQQLGGDLTCIAWNPAADDPYMFAAGSHDGAVRIWTRHQEIEVDDDNMALALEATPTNRDGPHDIPSVHRVFTASPYQISDCNTGPSGNPTPSCSSDVLDEFQSSLSRTRESSAAPEDSQSHSSHRRTPSLSVLTHGEYRDAS
ncbi:hypothetical protein CVT24_011952 [Panaeolus cyanescens]|uniref:Uncharacterized protein n=1 Tax=Panaeolus cyanescens TaxID=181874 RepID=A0A409VIC9_9AGAR|nr:hypothetical protein CVT24_011952 [Panaeolus cyanescens]